MHIPHPQLPSHQAEGRSHIHTHARTHLGQQHQQAVHSAQQRRVLRRLQQLQAQRGKGGGLQQRHQLAQLHCRLRPHAQRLRCHHSQQLTGQRVGLCQQGERQRGSAAVSPAGKQLRKHLGGLG